MTCIRIISIVYCRNQVRLSKPLLKHKEIKLTGHYFNFLLLYACFEQWVSSERIMARSCVCKPAQTNFRNYNAGNNLVWGVYTFFEFVAANAATECCTCYRVPLMASLKAQLSRYEPADAELACHVAAMFRDTIKWTLCLQSRLRWQVWAWHHINNQYREGKTSWPILSIILDSICHKNHKGLSNLTNSIVLVLVYTTI